MSDRISAINRRELWPLTAGEKARLSVALTRGGVAAGRGKSTTASDRAATAVWDDAKRRVAAEERAAEAERDRKAREKAAKKAARRFF